MKGSIYSGEKVILQADKRVEFFSALYRFLGIPKNADKFVEYIIDNGGTFYSLKNERIAVAEKFGVSTETINKWLPMLVKSGLLTKMHKSLYEVNQHLYSDVHTIWLLSMMPYKNHVVLTCVDSINPSKPYKVKLNIL